MKEPLRVHEKSALRVAAFLDGRPGHEKQTKSILTAMARMTPVDIRFINIQPGSFLKGLLDWVRYLGSRFFLPTGLEDVVSLDLIIGTGAFTHIPMIRLKRKCTAKLVTCMTPAFSLIREFDLCFIPRHDRPVPGKNIMVTTGPPICPGLTRAPDPLKGLVLIGGIDRRSHRWRSDMLIEQVRTILTKEKALTWTIASSRRTPKQTIDGIEKLLTQTGHHSFYRAEDTPAGWIETQYKENSFVWVTADSISMIFEAITAGCRVGILPVEWKSQRSKFKRCVEELIEKRWVSSFDRWISGNQEMTERKELNEAARCAVEILKRWWPDRLK
ncbi:MAG: mitochondrial fission ELM1 family protein [Deltaproteobacteria bacterium]|nr:mitochondrial fission ELM1 family protein [Deltaproteobacteria bacterium]MBW2154204.1 mitochondrial fission ELM1 family protein [Deltaproteobacteria bacterium]